MQKRAILTALVLGATNLVGTSCSGTTTTTASSSGAFGVVTVNGKQKLYLPLKGTNSNGNGQLAVVDVGISGNGTAGAPALVTNIDLGGTDLATCSGGTDRVVLAASTNSFKVWFIDPATDTMIGTLDLDPTLGNSNFSGGGGVVTGIAIDSQHNQAILSIWDGFAYVDLTSHVVTGYTASAPSENFGFDSARELILAPFYDCASSLGPDQMPPPICSTYMAGDAGMLAGLNVIRLVRDAGVAYTYENLSAPDPTNPLGAEPDSASVDTSTGLAVIPDEGSGTQYILDLGRAVFDDQAFTFTAPVQTARADGGTAFVYDQGVAVESATHLAFWEGEGNNSIAVVNLNDAYSGAAAPVQGSVPSTPTGDYWSNLGDPHGVAVTTGINSGGPVGFVVYDATGGFGSTGVWVARIDLQRMLSLGSTSDSTVDLSPAVTFLDASTKECTSGAGQCPDAGPDAG